MNRAEFDRFADAYQALHRANIRASGESPAYFAAYKARDLAARLQAGWRHRNATGLPPHAAPRILDFGTGVGNGITPLRLELPDAIVTGVDVSTRSLALARGQLGADAALVAFDGRRLPFTDASFDAVIAACVFHHIDAALHVGILQELRRVLRPGGLLMIYEHNPLNPLTVRAVNTCPFDENAVLIRATDLCERVRTAGFAQVSATYRVFFPALLKRLRTFESRLGWLPLGAQYHVTGIQP